MKIHIGTALLRVLELAAFIALLELQVSLDSPDEVSIGRGKPNYNMLPSLV